jgi:guanylate kinase
VTGAIFGESTMTQLLIISAPSGAGKSTLCAKLLARHPDLRLSVSTTTRAPREGEEDGVHYFFVSEAEFGAKLAEGDFLESATVHAHSYGTSRTHVRELTEAGHRVVFDVDVQGAASLDRELGDQAPSVMILPPSMAVLEKRLRGRATDDEATIRRRLNNARGEIDCWPTFGHLIVNDDLDLALADLEAILAGRGIDAGRRAAALAALPPGA